MPLTREQLLTEARQLPSSERQEFIEDLRRLDDDVELSAEQLAELRRRMAEVKSGQAILIEGDQVMREVREELGYR